MNTRPNLLRVVMGGLRCALTRRPRAYAQQRFLSHNSLPRAPVLSGVLDDIHFNFYRKKQ